MRTGPFHPEPVVVFGRSGAYAEVMLDALVQAGHRVVRVVEGLDRQARPFLRHHPVASRRRKSQSSAASSLVRAAHRLGIDASRTDDAHRLESDLSRLNPAAFVVLGFPHLFSRRLLAVPKKGGLNVHPGRLPEQRGPAPIFWALKRGEPLACTIHVLSEKEDAGAVVETSEISFDSGESYEAILRRMAETAKGPLVRALRDLVRSDLICSPQSEARAHRDPKPRFRDGRLNPDRNVHELYRFVAACARRHSLFVESAKDRFFIAGARGVHEDLKIPGEYLLDGDRLLWSCEGGVLELVLKPDGALFSADF